MRGGYEAPAVSLYYVLYCLAYSSPLAQWIDCLSHTSKLWFRFPISYKSGILRYLINVSVYQVLTMYFVNRCREGRREGKREEKHARMIQWRKIRRKGEKGCGKERMIGGKERGREGGKEGEREGRKERDAHFSSSFLRLKCIVEETLRVSKEITKERKSERGR